MSLDHLSLLLNILAALVLPVGYFIWRQVQDLRSNDLKHLEERHLEILGRLISLDEKFSRHLDFSESLHREQERRLSAVESQLRVDR